ncbi:hypothetical protein HMPREF1860_00911 [Prevotella amnii]|uniref:Uncharacterized protein n=1 Tax=Prevotella amnii TaxID=419005 RepID=A0A134BFQ7_9BACT|nr:hypothetical protein HMPREF1860_00911 [Prevotella amnii]
MSNLGSYVKAIQKVSTHLTEEPLKRLLVSKNNHLLFNPSTLRGNGGVM